MAAGAVVLTEETTADACRPPPILATQRLSLPHRVANVRPPVNVLVLAQTPPPLHGQSVMVQTMLAGLQDTPGLTLHHVNFALSADHADIGRWRPGKMLRVFGLALRAVATRFRHGCDTLYYVPAPAKRGALYRDWVVMAICRPFFRQVVLHWHAAGLGSWVDGTGTRIEAVVTRALLGRVRLSLVLGENVRADAAVLRPRQIAVVRNGIADPCPDWTGATRSYPLADAPFEVVYVGLCSREKGVLAAVAGVIAANQREPAPSGPRWRLTVAGAFADDATAAEFHALAATAPDAIHFAGFVTGPAKHELFTRAHALVFPTAYPHETQGLVVAEALAFDLPVIVTRWRAVHERLPTEHVYFVEPDRPEQIAEALMAARAAGAPRGLLRAYFLAHYTRAQHIASLREALLSLEQPARLTGTAGDTRDRRQPAHRA